ncbi:hypothetical protein [Parapedobacter lycopersici]|uniref:hypothetical protein n=1 Tax=Parapedobacter lycopersici TaxID=1864939 RepID=UPI00333EE610
MYSSVLLMLFMAFFLFYNTSHRMRWSGKRPWTKVLERRPMLSKSLAGLLTAVAALILIDRNGAGAGIFSLIVMIMGMGSLIVTLAPYRFLNRFTLVLLYLAALTCEYFIA